jgi:hypothetical protein
MDKKLDGIAKYFARVSLIRRSSTKELLQIIGTTKSIFLHLLALLCYLQTIKGESIEILE